MDVLPAGAGAPVKAAVFSSCRACKAPIKVLGGIFTFKLFPGTLTNSSSPPDELVMNLEASLITEAEPKQALV